MILTAPFPLFRWECVLCSRYMTASSTPTFSWYANCSRSSAWWNCGLRMWGTSRALVFIMCDVRATGLKSLSSLGCGFFGTGMRHDVFHIAGTFPCRRLRLKRCWRGSPCSAAKAKIPQTLYSIWFWAPFHCCWILRFSCLGKKAYILKPFKIFFLFLYVHFLPKCNWLYCHPISSSSVLCTFIFSSLWSRHLKLLSWRAAVSAGLTQLVEGCSVCWFNSSPVSTVSAVFCGFEFHMWVWEVCYWRRTPLSLMDFPHLRLGLCDWLWA